MGKQRTLGCRVVRSVLQCKSSRLSGGAVPFEGITSLWGWGFKDWTLPWESEAILVWGRQTGRGSSFEIWHMACANVWTFGLCKKSPRSRSEGENQFLKYVGAAPGTGMAVDGLIKSLQYREHWFEWQQVTCFLERKGGLVELGASQPEAN